jgi:hypothetical protein
LRAIACHALIVDRMVAKSSPSLHQNVHPSPHALLAGRENTRRQCQHAQVTEQQALDLKRVVHRYSRWNGCLAIAYLGKHCGILRLPGTNWLLGRERGFR